VLQNTLSAGTIQLPRKTALTLTLSPRRGNYTWQRWEKSMSAGRFATLERFLPLLGERAGVRENVSPTE
jgi:hypothetical protein